MDKKTESLLGFENIIKMLSDEAASEAAKARISRFKPRTELREIRRLLAETNEAYELIMRKGSIPLGQLYDIDGFVRMAAKGRSLTMRQLLQVLYNLRVTQDVRRFLTTDMPVREGRDGRTEPALPMLAEIADVLEPIQGLSEDIDRSILSEEEMSDNASPELKDIRRRIARQNESIRERLNRMVSSKTMQSYLQDAIVTLRDGRYCVPVKQEARSQVPGIVHDQSGSGATLFIEPQAVVEMNNELRELEIAERAEIDRILTELSLSVGGCKNTILNNQKLLVLLDIMNAKGRLAVDMKAAPPRMKEGRELRLVKARHPMLDPKKAVPLSLELGRDYDTLVITGPNTGGKTVALKTLGLLSMMAQTGLFIPASDGTELPVFTEIFADIGDEQSIEQSLSTFSSHMTGIVRILEKADEGSLVLLDELGAGTDPGEGAALAIAVLEELAEKGARILATTHYTELKKYAIQKERVENASMHFDIETLSPTYQLSVGVPGSSKAFAIAKKLGLEEAVLSRAESFLEAGDIAFEEVVAAIEQDRKKAAEDLAEAERLKQAAEEDKKELEKELKRLEREKDKIIERAREEAALLIEEAEETSKDIQEELRALTKKESLGERTKGFAESRGRLREAQERYRSRMIKKEEAENPADPSNIRVGSRVRILSFGENGEVMGLPDERGEVAVQMGSMKLKLPLSDLSLIIDGSEEKKKMRESFGRSGYANLRFQKAKELSIEKNVQGKSLSEATAECEKYLDDAFLAGLSEVRIIHGRGEGILHDGLAKMLKKNAHVASFRDGAIDEGGNGVTVVKLK